MSCKDWKKVNVGNLCNISSSKRIFASEYQQHGIPFYRGKEIIEKHNGNKIRTELFISVDKYNSIKDKFSVPQSGDLLLTSVGTLGVPYLVEENETFYFKDGNITWFSNFQGIDNKFLYYWLHGPFAKYQIDTKAIGSTQKALTIDCLRKFEVFLPPLGQQKKKVDILSSLDDKIELNNKINANLEQQAQAIFKSWFVDFEPFQDGEFVDSELGMIPRGWKEVEFRDFLTQSTERTNLLDIPEYSVTNDGIAPRDEKFKKQLSRTTFNNKIIRNGNLVFGMSREILNWGIMKDAVGGVSSAYNVFIIDEKKINPIYLELYMYAKILYFNGVIRPAAREGQGIDKGMLISKKIYLPPQNVLDNFFKVRSSIFDAKTNYEKQNITLVQLRDTLLPKLMSGEIEV